MKLKQLSAFLCSLVLLAFAVTASYAAKSQRFVDRPEVQSYIDGLVQQHGFSKAKLEQWLSQVRVNQSVLKIMSRPAEKVWSWQKYRSWLVSDRRVRQGVLFWQQNRAFLQRAEKVYGVPAEIIIAIIGIESSYGQHKGKFNTLDTLSTLGFFYKKRSAFFKKELTEFLLLAREQKIDPTKVWGSYAGALGLPQFIPSSYRHYAVDFSKDGSRDLFNSRADVIGSVANYFKRHGWQGNQPVALRARLEGESYHQVLKKGIKPYYSLKSLEKYGVYPPAGSKLNPQLKAALIKFDTAKGPEYWLAFQDFYAITRYNHSQKYAMAVYDLSRSIKSQYKIAVKRQKSRS